MLEKSNEKEKTRIRNKWLNDFVNGPTVHSYKYRFKQVMHILTFYIIDIQLFHLFNQMYNMIKNVAVVKRKVKCEPLKIYHKSPTNGQTKTMQTWF